MTRPYLTRPTLRPVAALIGAAAALSLGPAGATAASGGGGIGSPGRGGAGLTATPPTPGAPTTTAPTTPTSPPRRPTTPVTPSPPAASGQVVIHGGGNGHGIGMSQYGAEGYALHGASDRTILAHYSRGTAIGHIDPGM